MKSPLRKAQYLTIETAIAYGSPPVYGSFRPVYDAKVHQINIGSGTNFSTATVWFPALRWDNREGRWPRLEHCDRIRIKADRDVLFSGFITALQPEFSGSQGDGGSYERNAFFCLDHRWLLAASSPLTGQIARSPDDYTLQANGKPNPISTAATWMSGRRTVFNEGGLPDRDATDYSHTYGDIPIFGKTDSGQYWTAREMIRYCLSPTYNRSFDYFRITNPQSLTGLDHEDWDRVLHNVSVDGLNVIEALDHICRQLGWSFREDYTSAGSATLTFYKLTAADSYYRSSSRPTILHQLHAPAPGEDVTEAAEKDKKLLWQMKLDQRIDALVNNPWGIGAPHKYEITAELVPAWDDNLLVVPSGDDLYKTDAELQEIEDPETLDYYKYYHARGSQFRRSVGRRWALNESGRYSEEPFERGAPADLIDFIPAQFIAPNGKRMYAPFNRQLLPALTVDADTKDSVGILVEFSFDGGQTWQKLAGTIRSLTDEWGILIEEPNLAEMTDKNEAQVSSGDLSGKPLSLWTSLCSDKLAGNDFAEGNWETRVRVTASIQLDQRLIRQVYPGAKSGSRFLQTQVYDYSRRYGYQHRCPSSILSTSGLPANVVDATKLFDNQLTAIRDANQDQSISGIFTLDKIYPTEFKVGDSIEKLTGREYNLSASYNNTEIYPEIVQISYLPDMQKTQLITRDLRFAEVTL